MATELDLIGQTGLDHGSLKEVSETPMLTNRFAPWPSTIFLLAQEKHLRILADFREAQLAPHFVASGLLKQLADVWDRLAEDLKGATVASVSHVCKLCGQYALAVADGLPLAHAEQALARLMRSSSYVCWAGHGMLWTPSPHTCHAHLRCHAGLQLHLLVYGFWV